MRRYTPWKFTLPSALFALALLWTGAGASAQGFSDNVPMPMPQNPIKQGFSDNVPKPILQDPTKAVAMLQINAGGGRTYLAMDEYLTVGDYVVNEANTSFSLLEGTGRFCSYRGSPSMPGQSIGCWPQGGSGAGPYYLVYQADANLCLYRGTHPQDNRGRIWCAGSRNDPRPNYLTLDNGQMVLKPGTAPLRAGKLHSTMERAPAQWVTLYGSAYAKNSFVQTFRSQITSYPTELTLMFGAGPKPNNVRLTIAVNGVAAFERVYEELVEGSGGGYVFPLRQFPVKVNRGDWVSFGVVPSEPSRVQAAATGDPYAPPARAGVSDITSRFSMAGALAPDPRSYEDPTLLGSNLTGTFYYLNRLFAGTQASQQFKAAQTGVPAALGVSWCSAGGSGTALRLDIEVNGQQTFSKTLQVPHKSLTGDYASSCWNVLPIEGYGGVVRSGDDVKFTLTPPAPQRNAPEFSYFGSSPTARPGMSAVIGGNTGSLLKFYMKLR